MTCESKSNRHGMAPREWTKAEVRRCTMPLPQYLLLYRSRGQQQRCILVRPYHQDSMVAAEKATETKIEWCDLSESLQTTDIAAVVLTEHMECSSSWD